MKQDILKNNGEFLKFRNSLLAYGRKFNIPYEDVEELANDAIVKAIEDFIEDRGNLEAFCKVIFKNKLLNFQKTLKSKYIILIIEDENIYKGDDGLYYDKYENTLLSQKFTESLSQSLDESELKFFNAFKIVCEQSSKKLIAETSRALKIDNAKGWDLFRKIQRKANNLWARNFSDRHDTSVKCVEEIPSQDYISFQKVAVKKDMLEDAVLLGGDKVKDSEKTDISKFPEDRFLFRTIIIESKLDKMFSLISDSQLEKIISFYS